MSAKYKIDEVIFFYYHKTAPVDTMQPRLDIRSGIVAHIDVFGTHPYYHVNYKDGDDVLQVAIVSEGDMMKGIENSVIDDMVNL